VEVRAEPELTTEHRSSQRGDVIDGVASRAAVVGSMDPPFVSLCVLCASVVNPF
jgi:hypothetical protein